VNIEFNLQQLSFLALSANYRREKTYLVRIMQKICHHVNIEIVIAYVLSNCQYVDEFEKIMEHASGCIHYNQLLILAMIKIHWAGKKKDRFAKKDRCLFDTENIKLLITKDKRALEIYKKIIVVFDRYDDRNAIEQFDDLLNDLILFSDMVNA